MPVSTHRLFFKKRPFFMQAKFASLFFMQIKLAVPLNDINNQLSIQFPASCLRPSYKPFTPPNLRLRVLTSCPSNWKINLFCKTRFFISNIKAKQNNFLCCCARNLMFQISGVDKLCQNTN